MRGAQDLPTVLREKRKKNHSRKEEKVRMTVEKYVLPAAVVFLPQIKEGDTGSEEVWGGWTVPTLHKRAQMMLLKEAN